MEVAAILTKHGAVGFRKQRIRSNWPSVGGRGEGPTSFWTCCPDLVCNCLIGLDTKRTDSVTQRLDTEPLHKPEAPCGHQAPGARATLCCESRAPTNTTCIQKHPHVAVLLSGKKDHHRKETQELSSRVNLDHLHSWSINPDNPVGHICWRCCLASKPPPGF